MQSLHELFTFLGWQKTTFVANNIIYLKVMGRSGFRVIHISFINFFGPQVLAQFMFYLVMPGVGVFNYRAQSQI